MKHLIVLGQKIEAEVARQAGTTLMEVLLASTLTVILLTAAYSVAIGAISSYNTVSARSDAESTAQEATTEMARDIRQAEKPLLYIYSMTGYDEQLAFKADLNNDGTSEAILYEYQIYTHHLTRRVNVTGEYNFYGVPVDIVADNMVNGTGQAVFTYYGSDPGNPLDPASPTSDIINKARTVRVRLIIDEDSNRPPSQVELQTDIKLRNFAYGATR